MLFELTGCWEVLGVEGTAPALATLPINQDYEVARRQGTIYVVMPLSTYRHPTSIAPVLFHRLSVISKSAQNPT